MTNRQNEIRDRLSEANETLDGLNKTHKFSLSQPLNDVWTGKKTKVLKVRLDYEGFLLDYVKFGNPLTHNAAGEVDVNQQIFEFYLGKMSNIDILDLENLNVIGIDLVEQIRGIVEGFFILRLAIRTLSQLTAEKN